MPDAITTGVDHVNAGVNDVRAVAGVLTGDLGLGVAYPYSEYPEWVTAGVSVGDATLAIDSSESVWFLTPTAPARWRSVSLRPALAPAALAAALDQRGIANSGPSPYAIDGEGQWVNVFALGVLPPDEIAFFTRYSAAVGQQTERAHAGFLAAGGGPLGVTVLAEVAVGGQAEPWARMLAPVTRQDGSLRLASGARLRILDGAPPGVRHVVLGVRDLDAADSALEARGLAAGRTTTEVAIDTAPLEGLDLRLTGASRNPVASQGGEANDHRYDGSGKL